VEARAGAEQRPPRVGRASPFSFPQLDEARLSNGLAVQLFERRGLPLLELRLVVLSGTASEGDRPGVAALTAAAIELGAAAHASRELAERVESLGARVRVQTTRDASVFALTLPRSALDEGLALLGALTAPPRWNAAELEPLRRRELTRVQTALRHNPSWTASSALYAELFRASPRRHPYGHFDALPGDLERLTWADCSTWYEHNFSPKNAFLLAVGDTTIARLVPLAEHALGGWQGKEVSPPLFFTPAPPSRLKTLLVDHPHLPRTELRVATLGPERHAAGWSKLALLDQLLGAGESSRAQLALARHAELDAEVSSGLEEVAYGATPLVLSAQVASEQVPLALESLLDSWATLSTREPEPRELRAATEQLSLSVLLALETTLGAADLFSRASIAALPAGAFDEFRRELARISASDVRGAALAYLKAPPIVVVVGDAARLVTPLSRFGQVHVMNRDLGVERVVTQDPTAPLELGPSLP
jgi:predicted Zn-dependent peptidase